MRKIVLTFAAILVATCSYAQNFDWGVKAAMNLSSEYDTGEFSDGQLYLGFTAGFFTEFKVSNLLSIQPELLYSMQGSNNYREYNYKPSGYKAFVYQYLNLPIMFKFFVYQDKLSVDIGPQFGYLLKATEIRKTKHMATRNIDMKDQIEHNYDIAAAIGASYKFAKSFDVTARYTMGFMKTLKDEISATGKITPANNKNYAVQIGLGARF